MRTDPWIVVWSGTLERRGVCSTLTPGGGVHSPSSGLHPANMLKQAILVRGDTSRIRSERRVSPWRSESMLPQKKELTP